MIATMSRTTTSALPLTPSKKTVISIVFKATRRDVASHSFESPRRCLGDHKARQGDAICSTQENGEGIKKKNEKVKEEGQGT